jgi:hypothetical protein
MKGITTLAALPSGSGQAAHLPAEVGEARKPEPAYRGQGWTTIAQVDLGDFGKAAVQSGLITLHVHGVWGLSPGHQFTLDGIPYVCASIRSTFDDGGAEITCYRDERFKGD